MRLSGTHRGVAWEADFSARANLSIGPLGGGITVRWDDLPSEADMKARVEKEAVARIDLDLGLPVEPAYAPGDAIPLKKRKR